MATREVRLCDVFGTTREVRIVEVQVFVEGVEPINFDPVDLGKRARLRLERLIKRGLSPPVTRKSQD